MAQSILNDLLEIKKLNLDKESVEVAKKYQEYKSAQKPFWKTPSFLTILISAISITITALLGYNQLIQKQSKEIENQSKALSTQTENSKKQFESERLIIQNLMNDTLKVAAQKAQLNALVASIALDIAEMDLQKERYLNQKANTQLKEITNETQILETQKKQLLEQYDNLNQLIKEADAKLARVESSLSRSKDDVIKIENEKEKIDLIKLLYNLKSDIIKLLYPLKNTFTGKLYPKSSITIEDRNKIFLSLRDTKDKLNDNRLLNRLFSMKPSIKKDYEKLENELLIFEKSNSNQLIHNTRTYIDEISPTLDSFISKIDYIQYY